jgi:hypothetical protein
MATVAWKRTIDKVIKEVTEMIEDGYMNEGQWFLDGGVRYFYWYTSPDDYCIMLNECEWTKKQKEYLALQFPFHMSYGNRYKSIKY